MEAEDFEKIMQLYFSGSDSRALAVELMKAMEYELAEMFEEEIIRDFAFDEPEDYFDMMNDLTFSNCSFEGVKFSGFKNIIFDDCEFDGCIFYDCCLGGEFEYLDIFVDCRFENCHFNSISYSCDAENETCYFDEIRKQLFDCTFDRFYVDLSCKYFDGDDSLRGLNGFLSNCSISNISDRNIMGAFSFFNCSIYNCNLGSYFDGDVCRIYDCDVSNLKFSERTYNEFGGDLSHCSINLYGIDYEVQNILTGATLGEKFDLDILSWTYEISEINLDEKVFIEFDFSEKNMEEMSFVDCDLEDCDFRRSYLGGTDFEGANLEGAIFRGAELTGVNFDNADLTDADFTESTDYFKDIFNDTYYENNEPNALEELLEEMNVCNIEHLEYVYFLSYQNFDNCFLIAENFDGKDLEFSSFRNANLTNATFRGSNLKDADFSGAILFGVDFSGANLENTIFDEAKMEDAIFSHDFEEEKFEHYDESEEDEIEEEEAPELDLEDFPWRIRY